MKAFKSFRVILVIVVASAASYWAGLQAGRGERELFRPAAAREFSAPASLLPVEPTVELFNEPGRAEPRAVRELEAGERILRYEQLSADRADKAVESSAAAARSSAKPSDPKPPVDPPAPGNPGPPAGTEGKK